MPWLPDIKQRILAELAREPANQYELADRLAEPEFRIRGELAGLKRWQLVRNAFDRDQIRWELTDRGQRAAAAIPNESQPALWARGEGE